MVKVFSSFLRFFVSRIHSKHEEISHLSRIRVSGLRRKTSNRRASNRKTSNDEKREKKYRKPWCLSFSAFFLCEGTLLHNLHSNFFSNRNIFKIESAARLLKNTSNCYVGCCENNFLLNIFLLNELQCQNSARKLKI